MQFVNHWPVSKDLALPEPVKQSLLAHLIEPFGDEHTAKSFWSEYPSTIVILESSDSTDSLSKLSEITKQQIKFAFSSPEYSDELGMGYTIKLSITNDEGSGIYLIAPPNSQLTQALEEADD